MYEVPREETSATLAMTGFPHATEIRVSQWNEKTDAMRLTDDRLRDLDGGDETVLVERGRGEGEVAVGGLTIKRVDVRREADTNAETSEGIHEL